LIDTLRAFIDDGPSMGEREADVVVIGAGIAGCAAAYHLARRDVCVTVVERAAVAGEQSRKTWGVVRRQGRDPLEVPLVMDGNPGLDIGGFRGSRFAEGAIGTPRSVP
jgi:glycine/D-amino acid oxidase-like deaminating enzyme